MFSQRIKKGFGLSEVSTLIPADASGLTVRSIDAGTHKIDGFTFKNKDGYMVQAIKPGEKDLPEGLTLPPPRLYRLRSMIIQGLSKMAAPRTTHP